MGKLLVIDGLDGSGKGTITGMLTRYLTEKGVMVRGISFPMYGTKGAGLVEMYLNGELGDKSEDTNCYTASSFFAMDRYVSYKTDWGKFLEKENTVIIADRYTTANAVHQLTKLPKENWDEFLTWLFDYEYGKLTLPVPDKTVYLKMPPEISLKLIAKRSAETGRGQDIHEKDPNHLYKAYEAAMYATDKLGWITVDSFVGDGPRDLSLVFDDVLKALELDNI